MCPRKVGGRRTFSLYLHFSDWDIKHTLQILRVSVGLTGLPFGPSSPGGPLGPAGPAAPGGPASPFSPLSPLGPYRSKVINNTEGSTLISKVCSYYGQKSDIRSEAADRNWIQSCSQRKQSRSWGKRRADCFHILSNCDSMALMQGSNLQ